MMTGDFSKSAALPCRGGSTRSVPSSSYSSSASRESSSYGPDSALTMVLSGASIAVNLGAAVYNCVNGGDWTVLAACLLQSFLSLYLTVFVLGVITTITEWDNIYCSATKKVWYAITFPVFMFTYIPIVIVSLFHNPAWQPIHHSRSVDLKQIESLITERTKIVAMTQVSNVLGRKYPVQEVAAMAHKKGAVIVVDGAQSTPHIPVDVQALDADFFAFSGHKVYGPMGIGALYGREELLEEMPPFLTGGEMIESVTREGAVYAELPHKFEAGTVNAAGAAGLKAALEYVSGVGFAEMQRRELALTAHAMEALGAIDHVYILGSSKPEEHTGIVTFTLDGVHPHDISEILASDGVCVRAGHHCAQPLLAHLGLNATVRASMAFYNTPDEIDRLAHSLSTVRERMGYGK